MQRLCGLFSDSEEERRSKTAAFTWIIHYMLRSDVWTLLYSLRIRVWQTLSTMRKTWYFRWPTFLVLELIPQQLHYDGVYCLWPSIHIYKVRREMWIYVFIPVCFKIVKKKEIHFLDISIISTQKHCLCLNASIYYMKICILIYFRLFFLLFELFFCDSN